jgi:hypothetical protein
MRKRRAAVALALAAGAAAGAAHATSPPIIGGPIGTPGTAATTVVLSSSRAAARPVTLTVKLGAFPIICGRPRGSFVVTFPAAEQLPKAIAAEAVHVNGTAAGQVGLGGRDVTVTAPVAKGVSCLVMRLGTVTLVFTSAANLGNPMSAGTYALTVRHGTQQYHAELKISA